MTRKTSSSGRKGKAPGGPFRNQFRKGKTSPELTCVNCGETKKISRFPKRGGPKYEQYKALDPRKYDTQCKRCKKPALPGQKREDVTEPKATNRKRGGKAAAKTRRSKKVRLTASQYKQKVREETRIKSFLYLAEKGCEDCGERDPRKLEYDHKKPSGKSTNICRLIINGYSWSAPVLRAEIRKCRVLCANCHRKHTVIQQNYYDKPKIQTTIGELAAKYKFEL